MRKTRRISYRAARAVPQAPVLLLIVFVWTQATLGSAAEIRLKGGRVVSGTIESVAKDKVEIKTPGTTRLALPVASLEPPDRQWLDRMRQMHQGDPAQIRKCADLYVLFHPDEASAIASTLPPKEAAASPAPTPAPSPTPRVAPPTPKPTATPQPPPAPSLPRPTPAGAAASTPVPMPSVASPPLAPTPSPVSAHPTPVAAPVPPVPTPAPPPLVATPPPQASALPRDEESWSPEEIEKRLKAMDPRIVTLQVTSIFGAFACVKQIPDLEKKMLEASGQTTAPGTQGRSGEALNQLKTSRDRFLAEWEKGQPLVREYVDLAETADIASRFGAPQAELDRLLKAVDAANGPFYAFFQSLGPAAGNITRDFRAAQTLLRNGGAPPPAIRRDGPSPRIPTDRAPSAPRSPRSSRRAIQPAIRPRGQ